MTGKFTRWVILVIGLLPFTFMGATLLAEEPQIPAFPGAEGAGALTSGGRGGRVIEVTNLNDSGKGSLRDALNVSGPRIIVFRVGGTIELKTPIRITEPFVTIAGQTAPGDGITIKNEVFRIATHDVIIRYMRFRVGTQPSTDPGGTDSLELINNPDNSSDKNAQVYNVIIDHSSISWAFDENISLWNVREDINKIENVTLQWSVISEALPSPNTGRRLGFLLGAGVDNISIHHNLFANNGGRNPAMKGGHIEVVNNVMYNNEWDTRINWKPAENTVEDITFLNFIGNYAIKGTDSEDNFMLVVQPEAVNEPQEQQGHQVYVEGNMGAFRENLQEDEWAVVGGGWNAGDPAPRKWQISTPLQIPGVSITTQDYLTAYRRILLDAGASRVRDIVDKRVTQQVANRTGRSIRTPGDVGGYPTLVSGRAPNDTDHDGMPDDWESERGLNPQDPADSTKDRDGDGYTNVEEYINSLTGKCAVVTLAQSSGRTYFPPDMSHKIFLPYVSSGC